MPTAEPTADPYDAAPSAVMRVYLQQRRVDRLRSARRLARWLAVALVLVLITMTVLRGPRALATPAVIVALAAALASWAVTVFHDYRLQSSRIDSRLCLARLESVRRHLAAREQDRKVKTAKARRAGLNVLTDDHVQELHAQVRELECEIDESEQRVEHALVVGTVAAAFGAVALGAAVGAGALVFA